MDKVTRAVKTLTAARSNPAALNKAGKSFVDCLPGLLQGDAYTRTGWSHLSAVVFIPTDGSYESLFLGLNTRDQIVFGVQLTGADVTATDWVQF